MMRCAIWSNRWITPDRIEADSSEEETQEIQMALDKPEAFFLAIV